MAGKTNVITFNAPGPQGPAGPRGPVGPQGSSVAVGQPVINALDRGFMNDGSTPNDIALAALISGVGNLNSNWLHFPAGKYRFNKQVGPFPYDLKISGEALTGYFRPDGNPDLAPFPGGTTFLCYGNGVGIQLGHAVVQGNASAANARNGTIFEGIEVIGQCTGGNTSTATMTGHPVVTPSAITNTYLRDSGSFLTDGFKTGDTVYWGGFIDDANNGRHTIIDVSAGVMTVAETLVTHTSTTATTCYSNQYNDVGIEVNGDVGVLIRDCRIGGFKNLLSFDGCESCLAINIHFDGLIGNTGRGYPVADQQTDRGTDSAFCYRVGSFYFPSGVSGNKNTLQQANFNQCGWGFLTTGIGFDNLIRDCAFENGVGFGILENQVGFKVSDCSGEGASVATFKIIGTMYNVTFDNITGTTNKPLVELQATTYGLKLFNNYCRNHTLPPIKNSFHIIGGVSIGNLPPYSTNGGTAVPGKMFDSDDVMVLCQANLDDSMSFGVNCQPLSPLDVNGNAIRIQQTQSPASSSTAGNIGDVCWDTGFVYVKTGTATWKRAALTGGY